MAHHPWHDILVKKVHGIRRERPGEDDGGQFSPHSLPLNATQPCELLILLILDQVGSSKAPSPVSPNGSWVGVSVLELVLRLSLIPLSFGMSARAVVTLRAPLSCEACAAWGGLTKLSYDYRGRGIDWWLMRAVHSRLAKAPDLTVLTIGSTAMSHALHEGLSTYHIRAYYTDVDPHLHRHLGGGVPHLQSSVISTHTQVIDAVIHGMGIHSRHPKCDRKERRTSMPLESFIIS